MSGQGAASSGGNDWQPVKAKRQRTYRIGGQKIARLPTDKVLEDGDSISMLCQPSLIPPSEFDVSEMDRYFPPGGYELETRTFVPKRSRRVPPHR